MASNPPEFDPVTVFAPLTEQVPARNPFITNTSPTASGPTKNESFLQDFGTSFQIGVKQLGTISPWLQGAGASLLDRVGLTDAAREQRLASRYAIEDLYQDIATLESMYSGVHSWKQAREENTPGAYALWGFNELFKQVPNLATMAVTSIGTMGAGALVFGSARTGARLAINNAIKKMPGAKYTDPVTGEVVRSTARGSATAGVVLGSSLLNTGEIYSSALLETGESSPWVTGAAGLFAGVLDMWPGSKIIRNMGKGNDYGNYIANKLIGDSKLRARFYRAVELGVTEGAVEDFQSLIEAMTVNYLNENDLSKEYVDYAYGIIPLTASQVEERIGSRAAGGFIGTLFGSLGRVGPSRLEIEARNYRLEQEDLRELDEALGSVTQFDETFGGVVGTQIPVSELTPEATDLLKVALFERGSDVDFDSLPEGRVKDFLQSEANRLIAGDAQRAKGIDSAFDANNPSTAEAEAALTGQNKEDRKAAKSEERRLRQQQRDAQNLANLTSNLEGQTPVGDFSLETPIAPEAPVFPTAQPDGRRTLRREPPTLEQRMARRLEEPVPAEGVATAEDFGVTILGFLEGAKRTIKERRDAEDVATISKNIASDMYIDLTQRARTEGRSLGKRRQQLSRKELLSIVDEADISLEALGFSRRKDATRDKLDDALFEYIFDDVVDAAIREDALTGNLKPLEQAVNFFSAKEKKRLADIEILKGTQEGVEGYLNQFLLSPEEQAETQDLEENLGDIAEGKRRERDIETLKNEAEELSTEDNQLWEKAEGLIVRAKGLEGSIDKVLMDMPEEQFRQASESLRGIYKEARKRSLKRLTTEERTALDQTRRDLYDAEPLSITQEVEVQRDDARPDVERQETKTGEVPKYAPKPKEETYRKPATVKVRTLRGVTEKGRQSRLEKARARTATVGPADPKSTALYPGVGEQPKQKFGVYTFGKLDEKGDVKFPEFGPQFFADLIRSFDLKRDKGIFYLSDIVQKETESGTNTLKILEKHLIEIGIPKEKISEYTRFYTLEEAYARIKTDEGKSLAKIRKEIAKRTGRKEEDILYVSLAGTYVVKEVPSETQVAAIKYKRDEKGKILKDKRKNNIPDLDGEGNLQYELRDKVKTGARAETTQQPKRLVLYGSGIDLKFDEKGKAKPVEDVILAVQQFDDQRNMELAGALNALKQKHGDEVENIPIMDLVELAREQNTSTKLIGIKIIETSDGNYRTSFVSPSAKGENKPDKIVSLSGVGVDTPSAFEYLESVSLYYDALIQDVDYSLQVISDYRKDDTLLKADAEKTKDLLFEQAVLETLQEIISDQQLIADNLFQPRDQATYDISGVTEEALNDFVSGLEVDVNITAYKNLFKKYRKAIESSPGKESKVVFKEATSKKLYNSLRNSATLGTNTESVSTFLSRASDIPMSPSLIEEGSKVRFNISAEVASDPEFISEVVKSSGKESTLWRIVERIFDLNNLLEMRLGKTKPILASRAQKKSEAEIKEEISQEYFKFEKEYGEFLDRSYIVKQVNEDSFVISAQGSTKTQTVDKFFSLSDGSPIESLVAQTLPNSVVELLAAQDLYGADSATALVANLKIQAKRVGATEKVRKENQKIQDQNKAKAESERKKLTQIYNRARSEDLVLTRLELIKRIISEKRQDARKLIEAYNKKIKLGKSPDKANTKDYMDTMSSIENARIRKTLEAMKDETFAGIPLLQLPSEGQFSYILKEVQNKKISRREGVNQYYKALVEYYRENPRGSRGLSRQVQEDLVQIYTLMDSEGNFIEPKGNEEGILNVYKALKSPIKDVADAKTDRDAKKSATKALEVIKQLYQKLLVKQIQARDSNIKTFEGSLYPSAWANGKYSQFVRSDDTLNSEKTQAVVQRVLEAEVYPQYTFKKTLLLKQYGSAPVARWKNAYGVIIDKVKFRVEEPNGEIYIYTSYEVTDPYNPDLGSSGQNLFPTKEEAENAVKKREEIARIYSKALSGDKRSIKRIAKLDPEAAPTIETVRKERTLRTGVEIVDEQRIVPGKKRVLPYREKIQPLTSAVVSTRKKRLSKQIAEVTKVAENAGAPVTTQEVLDQANSGSIAPRGQGLGDVDPQTGPARPVSGRTNEEVNADISKAQEELQQVEDQIESIEVLPRLNETIKSEKAQLRKTEKQSAKSKTELGKLKRILSENENRDFGEKPLPENTFQDITAEINRLEDEITQSTKNIEDSEKYIKNLSTKIKKLSSAKRTLSKNPSLKRLKEKKAALDKRLNELKDERYSAPSPRFSLVIDVGESRLSETSAVSVLVGGDRQTDEKSVSQDEIVSQLGEAFGRQIFRTVAVVKTFQELPQHIQDEVEANYQDRPRAVTYNQTVYLIAENLPKDRVIPVTLHEIGGHGMQAVMGKRFYQKLMKQVAMLVETDPGIREIYELVKERSPKLSEPILLEETMAYTIETEAMSSHPFWRAVVDAILYGLARLKLWLNPKMIGAADILVFAKAAARKHAHLMKDEDAVFAANFLGTYLYSGELGKNSPNTSAEAQRTVSNLVEDVPEFYERGLTRGFIEEDIPFARRGGLLGFLENFVLIRDTKILPAIPGKRKLFGRYQVTPGLNIVKWLANYFEIFERFEDSLEKRGGVIDRNKSPAMYHGAYKNKVNAFRKLFHRTMVDPWQNYIQINKIDGTDLHYYMYAVHAIERNRSGKAAGKAQNKPNMSGMWSTKQDAIEGNAEWRKKSEALGVTWQDQTSAEQVLEDLRNKLGDEKYSKLGKAASFIYAINKRKVKMQIEAGLLNPEALSKSYMYNDERTFNTYVPLIGNDRIIQDEFFEEPLGPSKLGVGGLESKQALGRTTGEVENVWAHSVMAMDRAIDRIEKNKVAMSFAQLILMNANDLRDDMVVTTLEQFKKHRDEITGKLFAGLYPDKQADPDHNIRFKMNGQEYAIIVKDKRFGQAFNRNNMTDSGVFLQFTSMVNRWFSAVHTSMNPEFVATNFVRDFQTAIQNLQGLKETVSEFQDTEKLTRKIIKDVKSSGKGLKRYIIDQKTDTEWSQLAEEFTKSGGRIDFFAFKDVRDFEKKISDYIKDGSVAGAKRYKDKVIDFITNYNAVVENTMRLSTYKHAKDAFISNGMDEQSAKNKAADIARNLTVNFSQKGEWGSGLNSLYLFFNASVQGTVRLFQALTERGKNKKGFNRVQKISAGIVAYSFTQSMLNSLLSGDDEDGINRWRQVDIKSRSRQLHIFVPGLDNFIKIPLPYGYNVFHVIGDSIAAMMLGHASPGKASMNLVSSMGESFLPFSAGSSDKLTRSAVQTVSPTVVDPFLDLAFNENYFGQPIYKDPQWGSSDPPSERYWSSTGAISKATARTLNAITGGDRAQRGLISIEPDILEYIAETVYGGAGRFVERTFDTAALIIGPGSITHSETGDIKWGKMPFARRFLADPTANKNRFTYDKFSDYERSIDVAAGVNDTILKVYGRGDKYDSFVESDLYKVYRLNGLRKSVNNSIKKLQEQRNRISYNRNLRSDVKDRRIEELQVKMQDLRIKLIKRVDEVLGEEES
jgi:hypothetical protein